MARAISQQEKEDAEDRQPEGSRTAAMRSRGQATATVMDEVARGARETANAFLQAMERPMAEAGAEAMEEARRRLGKAPAEIPAPAENTAATQATPRD